MYVCIHMYDTYEKKRLSFYIWLYIGICVNMFLPSPKSVGQTNKLKTYERIDANFR